MLRGLVGDSIRSQVKSKPLMAAGFIRAVQSSTTTDKLKSFWDVMDSGEMEVAAAILSPSGKNPFTVELHELVVRFIHLETSISSSFFLENYLRNAQDVLASLAHGTIALMEAEMAAIASADPMDNSALEILKGGFTEEGLESDLLTGNKNYATIADRDFFNSKRGSRDIAEYTFFFQTLAQSIMLRWYAVTYLNGFAHKMKTFMNVNVPVNLKNNSPRNVSFITKAKRDLKILKMLRELRYHICTFNSLMTVSSLTMCRNEINKQKSSIFKFSERIFDVLLSQAGLYFHSTFHSKSVLVSMIESFVSKNTSFKVLFILNRSMSPDNLVGVPQLTEEMTSRCSIGDKPPSYFCPPIYRQQGIGPLMALNLQATQSLVSSLGLTTTPGGHIEATNEILDLDENENEPMFKPRNGMALWPVISVFPDNSNFKSHMPNVISILLDGCCSEEEPYFHSEKNESYCLYQVDVALHMVIVSAKNTFSKDDRKRCGELFLMIQKRTSPCLLFKHKK